MNATGLALGALNRWNKFWFTRETAFDLGFARFVFFLCLWFGYGPGLHPEMAEIPITFHRAVWFLSLIPWTPDAAALAQIILGWKTATLLAAAGLFTGFTVALAALGTLYLFGLQYAYGYAGPDHALGVMVALVLAFSPCAEAMSVDRVIKKVWPAYSFAPQIGPATVTRWPRRLILFLYAMTLFSAGLCKMRYSGSEWFLSDNLRHLILHNQYWFHFRRHGISAVLGPWILALPGSIFICKLGALAVVALELSMPGVLVSRRLRRILLPLGLIFHALNATVLMVRFEGILLMYLFFIPWQRLLIQWRLAKHGN